jgi:hypothetical protein
MRVHVAAWDAELVLIPIVDEALIAVSILRRFVDPEKGLSRLVGRLKEILAMLRRVHTVNLTDDLAHRFSELGNAARDAALSDH